MNKRIKNWREIAIIVLILILIPSAIKAQLSLFDKRELYPNTKIIIAKYNTGKGSSRYWSLFHVDSIGRLVDREDYHKKKLTDRQKFVFDDNSNKIFEIRYYQFNDSLRIDTTRYEYKYYGKQIISQYCKYPHDFSYLIELIENQGDTLLRYQEKTFYYRPYNKKTDVHEIIYTLRFKNGLLISSEEFDEEENSKEIIHYEYYNHGRLKRKVIEGIPEVSFKGIYEGVPESTDETYKYKLDSKGRIEKLFRIVNGKKYKIIDFRYE